MVKGMSGQQRHSDGLRHTICRVPTAVDRAGNNGRGYHGWGILVDQCMSREEGWAQRDGEGFRHVISLEPTPWHRAYNDYHRD